MPSTLDEDEDGVTMSGRIEIKGLTFSYETTNKNDHRVPTLRDINLTIEPGSRVGLVGPVGSGKSTLVNLLARVYPVPEGTIFLDGVDITTLPVASLRKNIGFVPQEAFLFSRTLRENIAFGQPESSDAQILKALQISNLERDLETMPDGMETMVGERGVMLSGGQRQRATLARAVIGNRSILILDDSLSSVDADTERTILARLDSLLKDRTSILISHRLSSLAVVDRIIVMDRGRIAEQGSHDELLASKGLYARLFHRHELECRLEDS
jgi:ATP-binding cassette subfamily B multidrug efflux pump